MNILNHLAIIMDGNGRWAKNQGLIRSNGHKAGANNIEHIIKTCIDENIKELSLFAFSTENWKRPQYEIDFIFKLLKDYLNSSKEDFIKNDIQFNVFGDIQALDKELVKLINDFKNDTKDCKTLIFNLGINYGSKDEINRTFKKIIAKNLEINIENIQNNLDLTSDVDLLIRTGNQNRISNFLLWQCAYAQIHFSPTLFPDFNQDELLKIISEYKNCNRTYGGL